MKICDGKVVELDPNKWFWMIVRADSVSEEMLDNIKMRNGNILIVNDIEGIEFVENPDRIKGIIVKEF